MTLDTIINGEKYSLVYITTETEEPRYYGIDVSNKLIFIYNSTDENYIKQSIEHLKRQYKN